MPQLIGSIAPASLLLEDSASAAGCSPTLLPVLIPVQQSAELLIPAHQSTPSCFSSLRASLRAHFTQLVSGLELRPRPSSSAGPISMPPYLQHGDGRPDQMHLQYSSRGDGSSSCKHGMCWLAAAWQYLQGRREGEMHKHEHVW
jgi:hypothetical protein